MNPKFPATLPLAVMVVGFTIAGCFPNSKTDIRKGTTDAAVTQASYTATKIDAGAGDASRNNRGQLYAPKRCTLTFITLSRPSKDPAINENLWRVADEQILSAEVQRTLQANGLRAGTITGSLPVDLEKVMNPPPPDKKPEPIHIDLPDGDATNVVLSTASEPITLLISRDGKTFGKDYDDAKGFLRVIATQDNDGGVKLKIVPLLQHGPNKQGYAAAPVGQFQPQEFIMKNGQAEELFRELAATVNIRPGQILAIGGRGEPGLSLGGFLFNQQDAANEKVEQHVVLVWAQSATPIVDESASKGFFRRGIPENKDGEASKGGLKGLFDGMRASAKHRDDSSTDSSSGTKPTTSAVPGLKR